MTSAKLRAVRVGDILCFNDGALYCRVTRVTAYPTIREMVIAETTQALGEPPDDTDHAVKTYRKIYSYVSPDEERGMLAFAVEVLDADTARAIVPEMG